METLRSVWNQTLPVTQTLILTEDLQDSGLRFPATISKILNNGLKHVDLSGFDYILRLDSDTVLPSNFVEDNLKEHAAVMGWGNAMLIHTQTFIKLMNGQFFEEQDDSYIRLRFEMEGYKSTNLQIKPIKERDCGLAHTSKYFVERGELMFQLGYEPFHVFSKALLNLQSLMMLVGYVKAVLCRFKRFDIACWVTRRQISELRHPMALLRKAKPYVSQKSLG